MDDKNSRLKIQTSRSGHPVPQLDEIYLHSVYNPIKEAASFADSQMELIKRKPNILILGLGFGYHIQEIISLQKVRFNNHKIVVIEPNKELVQMYKEHFHPNFEIYCYDTVAQYFEDINFTNYLTLKPTIIKHDPSFNTNKDFYVNFLTYRAPNKIDSFHHLLNPIAKGMLESSSRTLDESLVDVSERQHINSKSEYFLFALNAVARSAQEKI